jgi:hypothetical protein
MAVNLLHKLPLTYTINGIQYYTRTNQKVNNMNDSKELNDVNRINEVNISNKKLCKKLHYKLKYYIFKAIKSNKRK